MVLFSGLADARPGAVLARHHGVARFRDISVTKKLRDTTGVAWCRGAEIFSSQTVTGIIETPRGWSEKGDNNNADILTQYY